MKSKPFLSNILFWLAVFTLSCAAFFLVVNLDIPADWIKVFSHFGWAHFLTLTLIFYLLMQVKGRPGFLLGSLLAVSVFALPIALRLSTGLSNATILGGFIPYKDGFYYYNGARMLLSGQMIPADGLQGAFRPLFPGLISSLLFLTNQNLLLTLEMMVLLTSFSCYLAAVSIHKNYGPLPAAAFFSLTFAFIRPMLGDTLTEIPSLAFACLALVLLLDAGQSRNRLNATVGGILLVLALSIRAGAFFMLPFLLLWLGWLYKGEKKFSFKSFAVFTLVLTAAFLIFNMLFPRLIVEQGNAAFGNFSWMLYGQAVGGAGFQYHVQALGTSDSAVVLRAALDKVRTYPQGILIGSFKAYRDFFTNNSLGMFDLLSGERSAGRWAFWGMCLLLLLSGIVRAFRHRGEAQNRLLLAGFLGIVLSIPFLPPVDGGNRFYAGSVPFLFATMAAALPAAGFSRLGWNVYPDDEHMPTILRWVSSVSMLGMLIMPVAILKWNSVLPTEALECASGRVPYQAQFEQGSYLDILPDDTSICSRSPNLCLSRFATNGVDQANDDFYSQLVEMSAQSSTGMRYWAGIEWNSRGYYYLALPLDLAQELSPGQTFSGCAQPIHTQYQRILKIETVAAY